MVFTFVDVFFGFADDPGGQFRWCGFNFAALHLDFARAANEVNGIVPFPFFVGHGDAVGVAEGQVFVFPAIGRDDFHRAAVVHIEGPLHDVEHVGAPIGDHTAAKFFVQTPVREYILAKGWCQFGVEGHGFIGA